MKTAKRLLFGLLLTVLLASEAAAQEEIELLDGTTVKGTIRKVQADLLVLEEQPSGALLEIPLYFLSPHQQYQARKWRLKPGDLDPADPAVRFDLGRWAFEHKAWDDRLEAAAKAEFAQAEERGGAVMGGKIREYLERHGIHVTEKGDWVSAEDWHRARGDVWDEETQQWYTKEEWEEKMRQLEKDLKTKLLVQNPHDYTLTTMTHIDSTRRDFIEMDKNDKGRKVRFWAKYEFADKGFGKLSIPNAGMLSDDKFVRVVLQDEDLSRGFIDLKKADGLVARKLDLLKPGDRVHVFGRVFVDEEGFVILLDDLVGG